MADDKNNAPKLRVDETLWVLCTSPITLLMPTAERKLQPGGKETTGLEPLKLERGVNVLAGMVPTEAGEPRFVSLASLPAKMQQLPPAERQAAVVEAFKAARDRNPKMFEKTGQIPAVIGAVGTIAEIVSKHFDLLLTAAACGTHKASLEALSVHPAVPAHVRDLARTRLNAWRPAA